MAAPAVARSSGPPLCPSFAEVCSFLERYGAALDLPEMTFPQMERYLRDTTAVPKPLVELHVKLLRKLGRSVTTDRWEKYLAKVCQELNSTWAWELEQKGYQEMSMECKSSILKYLCECQFDDNLKFKMVVNEEDPEKMRLQPIGRDQQGLMYWLQLDQEQNIRLYTEEQDDLDGSTWKCIVRSRNDLAEALELLKAQIESNQCQDQDQNQNQAGSSSAEKDTVNEDFGVKNAKLLKTSVEQNDTKKSNPVTEKNLTKQVIKEEEIKQENTESKMEEKMDRKLAAFDNRVSTITAIKSEQRDADGPKNAVSVLISPSVSLMKLNKEDEAERAAVRCNQQAKIPLKKRDLKLAGCFQTNHLNNTNSSSIIVCNPSVINSKDGRGRDGKLLNSLESQGSPGSSLQQQQQVIASRQELTNGRAPHLPPREGHNGVIGQVGVVSHVGVIRSPSELHRAPGAEHREENGPKSESCGLKAADEGKEVSRQSVLVRKGQTDQETAPAASTLPPHAIPPLTSPKTDVIEGKGDSVSFSSQMGEDQNTKTAEKLDKERTTDHSSSQQEESVPEESRKEPWGAVKEEPGINSGTSRKVDSESGAAVSPEKADMLSRMVQQEQGVNGGLVSVVKLKKIGFVSEQKRLPLEEASSELQKEGIRLKIKIPPHRRNKLRRKEGKEEMKNREQEVQKEGRPLRRSARICRSSALPNCRPSSKVAESQRKKPQKKQTPPARTREEEEADEEDDDEEQSSPSTKNQKHEPAGKFSKRKGKRRHGRPRWTNVRPKRHKPNQEGEGEDKGKKGGEEEKGGSTSEEELCKSEEIPTEDACTHCGLPNHPELILLCDSCDRGYHTACLRPPLMLIPDGEWFCPPCQHKMLCEKLEEQLQNLDSALKKKERAERRRERLVYVGISVENIIPEGDGEEGEEEKSAKKKDPKKTKNLGRRSTRTRKHISYRFDDFDDAIDEAIEEDLRDLCSGAETGKEIPSVLSEVAKENQQSIRTQTRAVRNKKKRRLNDLESDSTAIESEEEFMLSNSSEEEEFAASGADDGEEDDEDAGSDGGSWDRGARPKRGLRGPPKFKPRRTQRRGRKRRRRRSSEEEEESDVEMDSDQFSDITDSDADKKRRGLRRGQRQQVNYRETSESSDNSRTSTKREPVKRRGRPRKEHFSSDYSDVSASSRDSEEDDDYDDEEEDSRRKVDRKRRGGEEELRSSGTREKRKRYKDEENEEGRRRLKRRELGKEDDGDGRRSSARTDRDEEDPERMGRGKRREMLSQQRRKRLAQMLKKRRPSTDDEEESESDDSQSSSGDDRPIRKRLNRIDSDDEEDEKRIDSDDEEDEGQKMTTSKKSSVVEQRAEHKNNCGAQEKGRGRSPSPSNGHQTSRDPGSPAVRRDGARSGKQERHNGPMHPSREHEEEEGQSDSLNSAQNSPQS